jgi:hypothetical protein
MAVQSVHASVLDAAIESELSAGEAQIDALFEIGQERAGVKTEPEPKKHSSGGRANRVAERARNGHIRAEVDATMAALTDEEKASLKLLQARTKRLRQLQTLFKDDPELMRIVDEMIGNQVKAAEQRQQAQAHVAQRQQTVFSVAFSVLSLIVGWLLSAVSPVSAVAHLVGH